MPDPFDPYHRWLGIPPEKQPPNHYVLLAIEPFEGDADVIAEAADRQMAHLRTHQSGKQGLRSQQLLNEVAAARICLLHPEKKAAYDKTLRGQVHSKVKGEVGQKLSPSLVGFQQQVDGAQPKPLVKTGSAERKPAAAGQRNLIIGSAAGVGVLLLLFFAVWVVTSGIRPEDELAQLVEVSEGQPEDKPLQLVPVPDSQPRAPTSPPQRSGSGVAEQTRPAWQAVSVTPGRPAGLSKTPSGGDGKFVQESVEGRPTWRSLQPYLYFDVDDGVMSDGNETVEMVVDYLDAGPTGFQVQYDSCDPALEGIAQRFRHGPWQSIEWSGRWKEARFVLQHARFADRTNGTDFRLSTQDAGLVISQISVRRMELAEYNPMAIRLGPWYKTSPLPAKTFDEPKFPEIDGIDVRAKDNDNRPRWEAARNASDGMTQALEGLNTSTYLYRIVKAKEPTILPAEFGSDDALIVWLNGKKIISNDVRRSVMLGEDKADLPLKAGENELLIRVHNYEGSSGYCFYAVLSNAKPREGKTGQSRPGQELAPTGPPLVPDSRPTSEPTTPPEARLPVPLAAQQNEMLRQFDEVYRFSQPRTPAERLKVANDLLALSRTCVGKPVEKFVALSKAMEMARDGGDADLMLKIVDATGAAFDVPLLESKQKALADFISGRPDAKQIRVFLEAADPVIGEAIAAGRRDIALSIAEAAYQSSRQVGDAASRKQAYDRRNEIRKLSERFEELQATRAVLNTEPDDPAANLVVGRWLCFERGDWTTGLPHLAKSNDASLAALAEQDLALPSEPSAQVQLADAWWDASEARPDREKEALQLRAGVWYQKALPRLPAGLKKIKVERRLAEIGKVERLVPGPAFEP